MTERDAGMTAGFDRGGCFVAGITQEANGDITYYKRQRGGLGDFVIRRLRAE
ncbi:MAG: hypothetical protein LBO72_07425 [Helicobacteraceae bacterium]|nr:hypothetical protein [Helicobacteraceae bacterium]